MAKITKEYQVALIKEFMPRFDFEKGRTQMEIASIINIIDKKRKQKYDSERFTEASAVGFTPGCTIVNDEGKEAIFSSITKNGYIKIKGSKGSFNHTFWKVK